MKIEVYNSKRTEEGCYIKGPNGAHYTLPFEGLDTNPVKAESVYFLAFHDMFLPSDESAVESFKGELLGHIDEEGRWYAV